MKRLWHAVEDGAILAALGLGPLLWGGLDIGIETPAAAQGEARRTVALALVFGLMMAGCLARLARRLLERGPDPIVRTPADLPALALLVWMGLAVATSRYRYASLMEWYRVAAVLMLIWLVANRPAWTIRRIEINNVLLLGGDYPAQTLHAAEVSSHPELNRKPTTLVMMPVDGIKPTAKLVLEAVEHFGSGDSQPRNTRKGDEF